MEEKPNLPAVPETAGIATQEVEVSAALMEQLVVHNDLSQLTAAQRLEYYNATCRSLGLNPLTRPFSYLELSGKLTLYANKDAAEQLRKLNGISISDPRIEYAADLVMVTVSATDRDGRTDVDMGAVPLTREETVWEEGRNGKRYPRKTGRMTPLVGEERCNAVLKAITKAKRRVTLSISGLGMLDETEVETIRDARPAQVDFETGEVLSIRPPAVQEDPTELLMKHIHYEGDQRGLNHDELRTLALGIIAKTGRVITSMTDMTPRELQGFLGFVQRYSGEELRAKIPPKSEEKEVVKEAESGSTKQAETAPDDEDPFANIPDTVAAEKPTGKPSPVRKMRLSLTNQIVRASDDAGVSDLQLSDEALKRFGVEPWQELNDEQGKALLSWLQDRNAVVPEN